MDPVTRLGVVGCGLMGSGIAEVAARSGIDVRVAEATPVALDAGRRRLTASLDRGVRRGKLSEEQRDQALARLSFTHDLSDMADRQFVVEAVAENRDIKTDVLRLLTRRPKTPRRSWPPTPPRSPSSISPSSPSGLRRSPPGWEQGPVSGREPSTSRSRAGRR